MDIHVINTVNNYNSRLYFNTIQVLIVVISISSKIFVFKMFPRVKTCVATRLLAYPPAGPARFSKWLKDFLAG